MGKNDVAFGGSVPQIYDECLGPFLFEPYALDLIGRIPSKKIDSVLEIACGTGRVTKHLRNYFPSKVKITALDLNADMIAIAQRRVAGKVEWKVADAQSLPFESEEFELVVCQFGLMFMPDKIKALQEAYRVLKPGGCFLLNTWDKIENNMAPYLAQKIINSFFDNDAPTFYSVPFSMHDMQELGLMLEKSKFKNSEIIMVAKEGISESANNVAKGYIEGNPIIISFNEKNPKLAPAIISRLTEEFELTLGNHPMKSNLQAWVAKTWKLIAP
ncbi:MAG: ubiquinone biosynthesis protein UbiE [Bacteroidetes bacterium]|nr:MAG: ubiquinone biosynthesis protein UbiE [Bacteroidota bacterium]